jgi:hypothetical protein
VSGPRMKRWPTPIAPAAGGLLAMSSSMITPPVTRPGRSTVMMPSPPLVTAMLSMLPTSPTGMTEPSGLASAGAKPMSLSVARPPGFEATHTLDSSKTSPVVVSVSVSVSVSVVVPVVVSSAVVPVEVSSAVVPVEVSVVVVVLGSVVVVVLGSVVGSNVVSVVVVVLGSIVGSVVVVVVEVGSVEVGSVVEVSVSVSVSESVPELGSIGSSGQADRVSARAGRRRAGYLRSRVKRGVMEVRRYGGHLAGVRRRTMIFAVDCGIHHRTA